MEDQSIKIVAKIAQDQFRLGKTLFGRTIIKVKPNEESRINRDQPLLWIGMEAPAPRGPAD